MGAPGVVFPEGPFDIVLADPPWDYDNRVQHGGAGSDYTSGAEAFYPTMTLAELEDLPVKSLLARHALIYMWTTGPQVETAMRVLRAWGAPYKTVAFVWDKQRVNPGAYTMSQTEFVLVGKRGAIPKPRGARNVRQWITEARTTYSRKTDEVHRRIDRMHPEQRKIELFARRHYPGWTCWGNELP